MPEGKGYSASRGLCVSTYSGLDQDSLKSHLLLQLLPTLPLPFSKMPIRITNSILTFPRIKCSYFYQQVPIQLRNFSKFKWNEPTRAAMSDLGMQSEYLTDNWTPSCYPADFIACLLQCKTGNVTEKSYGTRWFHKGPGNNTTTVELLKSPEFTDENLL